MVQATIGTSKTSSVSGLGLGIAISVLLVPASGT